MAANTVYLHDLPYKPRKNLCRILDADYRWEELGGMYMNYDVTTLTLIGQAIHRDKSPTWELLNKYSEKNGTINHLYKMLAQMDHQRAMSVLMPYVDPKYHCLLRNESTTSSFSCSEKKSLYGITQLSMSTSRHRKEVSKYQQNFVNLDTLHSKMNSLNVQKSPNLDKFKENSNNFKEESTSDNCIPEKMKGTKNSAKDGTSENEKQRKQSSILACAMSPQEDCLPDILRIPYADILSATDDFNGGRVLGRGGFGTVYRGEWKGTSVAIKRLTPRHSSTQGPSQQMVSLKQSLNELNVLKTCRFDHILPLYAVSLDGENPCLVYQLMVNGSLEDRLLLKYNTSPLTWSQRSHIAECTTKGLNYLHTTPGKPLVHGDIKSANILLDANMDAKIGDFGLTREGPGCQDTHVKVSSVHGTECYLPPEYLRQKHLSPQVDIYSYGIVLLEIATGLRPFDSKRGKGSKRLPDHVSLCVESGRLESLRDTKAGEEKMIWFRELIRIGQTCSNMEKKKRPPMNQMLVEFERIKQEMSMMDIIRRLSNDRGSSQLPSDLPPIGIQMYYDFQRQSGTTHRLSPGGEQSAAFEPPSEQPKQTAEEERGGYGMHVPNSVLPNFDEGGGASAEKTATDAAEFSPAGARAAPLPLLSILRLQVSEIDNVSSNEEFSSQTENSAASTDYISED